MRYDLNLLPIFVALLEERSVTRAADRLGMTQSALSNALTRLRTVLQDPLFIRERYGMRPTPKAEALAPALTSASPPMPSTSSTRISTVMGRLLRGLPRFRTQTPPPRPA